LFLNKNKNKKLKILNLNKKFTINLLKNKPFLFKNKPFLFKNKPSNKKIFLHFSYNKSILSNKLFFYNKLILCNKLLFYCKLTDKKTSTLFFKKKIFTFWIPFFNKIGHYNIFIKLLFIFKEFLDLNSKHFLYYNFYLNNFLFLKNKFNFLLPFASNLKKKNLSDNVNFFNFYRHSFCFFQKKLQTPNLRKFNNFYSLLTNDKLKFYSIFFFKKRKTQTLSLFLLSKLFFFNFISTRNFFNKRSFNFFKFSKYDWINESLAKLTKSSITLNSNEFFTFKILNKTSIFSNSTNINPFFNFIYTNDDSFFEKNIFLSLKKKNKSFFNFFKKKYSINRVKTQSHFFSKIFNKNLNNNLLKKNNNLFFINRFEFILFFFFKPLFFKHFNLFLNFLKKDTNFCFKDSIFYFIEYFFYQKNKKIYNNIIPDYSFSYFFKKQILKIFNYSKFNISTILWQYSTLIRFLEFCSGKKVYLKLNPFLNTNLNFNEKAQCLLWSQKVKYFRKVLGPRLFLNESLQIIYLSLKLKDPYVLSNWMVSTMQKISFWKYKTFLRYIKYVLRYFFWVIFKDLRINGIKFQLKGKISVAGNARTRTVFHNVGFTSHSTFTNKILYHLNLVRTFTGVLGLKLWIVF